MAALVRWNPQRKTWQFVDRPPKGKPETETLGPSLEDKERGERRAQIINANRADRAEKTKSLSAGAPLYGEAVLRAWWESAKGSCVESTIATNEGLLEHHLIPFFGQLDLRLLRREDVKAFGTRCGKSKEDGGAEVGVYTVQNACGILHRALRWCVEGQLLSSFSMERMTSLAVAAAVNAGATKGEREAWAEGEVAALLEVATPELRRICFAALHTGARYGELLALTWPCINFEDREIRIEKSQKRPLYRKYRASRKIDHAAELRRTKVPKNRKTRVIDMSPELASVLKRMRAEQRPLDPEAPLSRVFLAADDKPWNYNHLRYAWEKCRRRAHHRGARALPFHSWRHTFVSMAIAQGAELPWVARQIGDTLQTMLDHYQHFIPRKKLERFGFLSQFSVEEPAEPSPAHEARGRKG